LLVNVPFPIILKSLEYKGNKGKNMQAPQRIGTVMSTPPITTTIDEKMFEFVLGLSSLLDAKGVRKFFDDVLFSENYKIEDLKHLTTELRGVFFELRQAFQGSKFKFEFQNMLIEKLREILDPNQPYYKENQSSIEQRRTVEKTQEVAGLMQNCTVEPIEIKQPSMSKFSRKENDPWKERTEMPQSAEVNQRQLAGWKPCLVTSQFNIASERHFPNSSKKVPDLSLMVQEEIIAWAFQNHLSGNEVDYHLADMTLEQLETWAFINQKSQSDVDRLIALKLQKEEIANSFAPQPQRFNLKNLADALSDLQEKPINTCGIPRTFGPENLSLILYNDSSDAELELSHKPGLRDSKVGTGRLVALSHTVFQPVFRLSMDDNLIVEASTKDKIITCSSDNEIIIKEECRLEIHHPCNTIIKAVSSELIIIKGINCQITLDRECKLTLIQCQDCLIIASEEAKIEFIQDSGGNKTQIKK